MMIFLTILFFLGLAVLLFLVYKKWDQLKLLDPQSDAADRSKKLKYDLLRQRMERAGSQYAKKAQDNLLKPVGSAAQLLVRRLAAKLSAVEESYKKQKIQAGERDLRVIDDLIKDAKNKIDKHDYEVAEKKLIEAISLDPRNIEAYEILGRLYLLNKDYNQAEETFKFLLKLSPENPSVITALGEVNQKKGDVKQAYNYFKKAAELSPKNPKYLDFLIEACILIGDTHEAQEALDKLVAVNAENNKIKDFEKRIQALIEKKKAAVKAPEKEHRITK